MPPFSGYKAEKKIPFFWIILLIVAVIASGLIYVITRSGSSSTSTEKETEKSEKSNESSIETPAPKKDRTREISKTQETQIPGDIDAKIQTAENLILSGNLLEARNILREMRLASTKQSPALEKIEKLLGKVNIEIFKSDIPCPEKILYTIEKGDVLIKLADKFNTTVEAIQTANQMPPGSHTIFPGKTLCIYNGNWKILISKAKMSLLLMNGDEFFKSYKVSIGKQGRTPSGEFEISMKQKDPTWYVDGKAIPFGNPENVLGTRWLALTAIASTNKNIKGYGIHGTWDTGSMGHAASNGCVRMLNEEVEELFAIVPQKTKVFIED